MVIAIDGPSGAGKSTIARSVAKELGFGYLDTGALYRGIAAGVLSKGVDVVDEKAVKDILPQIVIRLNYEDSEQQIYINNENYTSLIRTPEVSMGASAVAAYPFVREKLLSIQRETGKTKDIIVDGRDIGTVVFPNAEVKIFLTASPKSRAERRVAQNQEQGIDESYEQVLEEIIKRDKQDENRLVAPLKKAKDAILVDTTNFTLEESIEWVKKIIKNQRG